MFHVLCTPTLTLIVCHRSRGRTPSTTSACSPTTGVIVHAAWPSRHPGRGVARSCNAHLVRHLAAVGEVWDQAAWTKAHDRRLRGQGCRRCRPRQGWVSRQCRRRPSPASRPLRRGAGPGFRCTSGRRTASATRCDAFDGGHCQSGTAHHRRSGPPCPRCELPGLGGLSESGAAVGLEVACLAARVAIIL